MAADKPLRPRTFGLSVDGGTAAAIKVGISFENAIGKFADQLDREHPSRFRLSKDISILSPADARLLRQFFAVCSSQLGETMPTEPKIGDVYRRPADGVVMIRDPHGQWKEDEEGVAPDRVLLDTTTGRFVLIEAKYGDTEGNAHIERAGARATPSFLGHIDRLFGGRAKYLHVFSGPMVDARSMDLGEKRAERGVKKGRVVQTSVQRTYASARYHRQIEALFSDERSWTLLWTHGQGLNDLARLFSEQILPWLSRPV